MAGRIRSLTQRMPHLPRVPHASMRPRHEASENLEFRENKHHYGLLQ